MLWSPWATRREKPGCQKESSHILHLRPDVAKIMECINIFQKNLRPCNKEEPDIKLSTSIGSSKKLEFQKNIYSCFLDYAKAFVWITANCVKFWKRWEYQTIWPASWEICMQIKKQQLELDMEQQSSWFQIRKGVCQGCILSLCSLNLFAEYIMRNAGVDEAQAGIKIAGRNINNLRYADDTTLMAKV